MVGYLLKNNSGVPVRGEWRDPAADRFANASEAVALLEQNLAYLGETYVSGVKGRIEDRVEWDRFVG